MDKLKEANDIMFKRYYDLIENSQMMVPSDEKKTSLESLQWMCKTAIYQPMGTDKAGRWLGFVQGCLTMHGLIDVDEERDFSRPLFHSATGFAPTIQRN